MSTKTEAREVVKIDLDDLECSNAKISVRLDADKVWLDNSVEYFLSADSEAQTIWVNARFHHYTSVDGYESVSEGGDLFSRRMSKAEAEALVAVLQNELSRL